MPATKEVHSLDQTITKELDLSRDRLISAALHWRTQMMEPHEPTVRTWQDLKLLEAAEEVWALLGIRAKMKDADES